MKSKIKGELCLFVSYAPGVGKTHHMIKFAKEREVAGEKVYYAHIYSGHRTIDSEKSEYSMKEILHVNPNLVVLDELVMKERNIDDKNRYIRDDVEMLLANGIDVYSTVNLLHFSEVNDACKYITGFSVKRPLSDQWLNKSKSIIYIDYPPEILNKTYENNAIFTKIKKGKATDSIFKLKHLQLYRKASIHLLDRFNQVIWISRED